jgi:hypothetical protein
MLNGKDYIQKIKSFFSFLEKELNFKVINEIINGNAFYDVEYSDKIYTISISYENITDHIEVTLFKLQNGKLPHYDDKSKSLHLKNLNTSIIPKLLKTDIQLNNKQFRKFKVESIFEKKLLKEAKELRICLLHINLLE